MIEVKPIQLEDLEALAEIEREVFKKRCWSETSLKEALLNPMYKFFGAFEKNILIGYLAYEQILDEAHIMNIAVKEGYRFRGVGTMLLENLLQYARANSLSGVTLEVSELNLKAISFYQKFGFVLAGKRPDYYNIGEAAFIYWLYF